MTSRNAGNAVEEDPVRPMAMCAVQSKVREREGEETGGSSASGAAAPEAAGAEEARVEDMQEDGAENAVEEPEVRRARPGKVPKTPTQAELSEHLPLHINYRDWCPVCVKGAGIHDQRRRTQQEEEKFGTTIWD